MIKRTILLSVLGLSTLFPAFAQEQAADHPLKPMLWKVEGGELKQPSWLFGTIHLGSKPVSKLHPAAAKAFDASDVVYTEVPMDPQTQMGAAVQLIRKDGKTLSDSIGAPLRKQLNEELQAINPNLSPEPLDMLKTWAVAVTLPILKTQLAGEVALDSRIWQNATTAGKQTKGLETIADQLGIFDQLTEEEQVALLAETMTQQREERVGGKDSLAELLNAYVSGDPAKVDTIANAQFAEMAKGENKALGLKIKKLALDDRNISIAKTISGHLKAEPAKTHFFAVGTGHYVGEGSICEQLRKQGYTVTLFQP